MPPTMQRCAVCGESSPQFLMEGPFQQPDGVEVWLCQDCWRFHYAEYPYESMEEEGDENA